MNKYKNKEVIILRTSVLNNILVAVVLVLALFIITCSLTDAQAGYKGYKEEITVDGTTWSIERSTLSGTLEIKEEVNVTGMVIRDSSISNFVGICAEERTIAQPGTMIFSQHTSLVGIGGGVVITREIKNEGENKSANITITEVWPTLLSTTKAVGYSGTQISTEERYENSGEVISTSFVAKELAKASRYDTALLRMDASAEIQPGYVNQTVQINKSTNYALKSLCIGKAYVGYKSGEGSTKARSSEYYFGTSKIEKSIKAETEVPPAPTPAPPTPTPSLCPFP